MFACVCAVAVAHKLVLPCSGVATCSDSAPNGSLESATDEAVDEVAESPKHQKP